MKPTGLSHMDALFRDLELRFKSGNSVPVERAALRANEWEHLKQYINLLSDDTRTVYLREVHSLALSSIGMVKMALMMDDPKKAMAVCEKFSEGLDTLIERNKEKA